ncbi:glutamate NMDA receptor subunit epsilon-1, putative (DUF3598) [Wolffia australiana]
MATVLPAKAANPRLYGARRRKLAAPPPLSSSAAAFSGGQRSREVARGRRLQIHAVGRPFPLPELGDEKDDPEGASMNVGSLRLFVDQNIGKWNGSFYQFDPRGNVLQNVATRLSASSYGEDDLISLIQTLYIKQAPSKTFSPEDDGGPEWIEYKIKETNIFTADKYQQISFFPEQKAFALRYQTAGMLETVLRAGVLGEDDTGEESPRGLMLPSRRPALVCENCLNSIKGDSRARAFHVLDPKGIPEMFLIFLEGKESNAPDIFSTNDQMDSKDRLAPFLGRWEGRSLTKRSGLYGSTMKEADVVSLLEVDEQGRLVQDITSKTSSSPSKVHWTGEISGNMAIFEGGYQLTWLPGGMYVGCPCDVSRCVAEMQSFHLEFCWMESSNQRQRLVRTYDSQGLPVSSTYFLETKA